MKEMLEEEARRPGAVLDHAFIEQHTTGFADFAARLAACPWDEIVAQAASSGRLSGRLRRSPSFLQRIIVCWAMGLTQHVQRRRQRSGDRELPAAAGQPRTSRRRRLPGARPQQRSGRPHHGHLGAHARRIFSTASAPSSALRRREHTDSIQSTPFAPMLDGRAKVFFALGGNFLSAAPDTECTAEALRKCRLTVQVSTKLNRGHLVTGKRR